MEIILKHLSGDKQYKFLDILLSPIFDSPNDKIGEKAETIQRIMDEINK